MNNCVFCSILRKEEEASFVYQDELSAAFLDIQPVNPGHTLVVPTKHVATLSDMTDAMSSHLMLVARKIATAIYESEVAATGVNLLLADGESAGQEVFHVHLHVIPRSENDGFGFKFGPHYWDMPTRDELDSVAHKLTSALDLEHLEQSRAYESKT